MKQLEAENLQEQDRVHLAAYVDRDLAAQLAELAREHDRSLSAEIRRAVTEHLTRERRR
jgi:predicted transcriptional regulator